MVKQFPSSSRHALRMTTKVIRKKTISVVHTGDYFHCHYYYY